MQNEFLTVIEAAEYLRIDESTIRSVIHRGDLPALKIGRVFRIKRVDLETYINRQTEAIKEQNK